MPGIEDSPKFRIVGGLLRAASNPDQIALVVHAAEDHLSEVMVRVNNDVYPCRVNYTTFAVKAGDEIWVQMDLPHTGRFKMVGYHQAGGGEGEAVFAEPTDGGPIPYPEPETGPVPGADEPPGEGETPPGTEIVDRRPDTTFPGGPADPTPVPSPNPQPPLAPPTIPIGTGSIPPLRDPARANTIQIGDDILPVTVEDSVGGSSQKVARESHQHAHDILPAGEFEGGNPHPGLALDGHTHDAGGGGGEAVLPIRTTTYSDNLGDQINGVATHYTTDWKFLPKSLQVSWNGVVLIPWVDYEPDGDRTGFTFLNTIVPSAVDQDQVVAYYALDILENPGFAGWGSGGFGEEDYGE